MSDTDPGSTAAEPTDGPRGATAPYMSFQGFRSLLDRLGTDGLPQVFDQSFFPQSSGSLIAQTRGTLKFFDLIDEERRPTSTLKRFVEADEARRLEILRDLAEAKYADVIDLGSNATQGQLAETFRGTGLSGASVTKAITFYIGLADYVGLPVSPFFKKVRAAPGNGGSTRRSPRRRKAPAQAEPPAPLSVQPQILPLEEKRAAYIDLLMKLAEQSGEKGDVQENLLNRLERALGYETSSTQEE